MVGAGSRWARCCKTCCLGRSCQEASVHWLDCPVCWQAGTCCNLLLLLLLLLDLRDLLRDLLLDLRPALTGLACWAELTGHSQQVDLQPHRVQQSLEAGVLLPLR